MNNMVDFNYRDDDMRKVVPLKTGIREFKPEGEDIPIEERKKEKELKEKPFKAKSGTMNKLKAPRILKFPVVDNFNNPLPGQLYRIYLPSGKIIFGETDDQGILKGKIYESGVLMIEMEDGSSIKVETE